MKKNLVTIIAPLRDDNYHEDSLTKTQFTIQYALETIHGLKLEKNFSITLVDWGSKKPISEKIFIPKKFQKNITCYYVSEKIAKKESDEKFRLNVHKCWNIAERLTNAEYSINAHIDQIYSKSFFVNIKQLIDGNYLEKEKLDKTIFWIPRKFGDEDFFSKRPWPSKETVDKYFENINFASQQWKNPGFFVGGGPAGFLAKTSIFRDLKGAKEDYISKTSMIMGDEEFYQKGLIKYNFVDSSNFGIMSYRFGNSQLGTRFKLMLNRLGPVKFDNPDKGNLNWGLKNKKIRITKFSDKILKTSNNIFEKDKTENYISNIKKIKKISKSEIVTRKEIFSLKTFLHSYVILALVQKIRTFCYLEYGYKSKNTLSILGSFQKGMDLIAADFSFTKENQNIMNRLYAVSAFYYRRKKFHAFRHGNTKLVSYFNIHQSYKIFNYIPNELFGSIVSFRGNIKVNKKIKNIILNKKKLISIITFDSNKNEKFIFNNNYKNIFKSSFITIFLNKNIDSNKILKIINSAISNKFKKFLNFLILILFRIILKK